jgi:hypothetical protein
MFHCLLRLNIQVRLHLYLIKKSLFCTWNVGSRHYTPADYSPVGIWFPGPTFLWNNKPRCGRKTERCYRIFIWTSNCDMWGWKLKALRVQSSTTRENINRHNTYSWQRAWPMLFRGRRGWELLRGIIKFHRDCKWRWLVSVEFRPPYISRRNPQWPLNRRLGII